MIPRGVAGCQPGSAGRTDMTTHLLVCAALAAMLCSGCAATLASNEKGESFEGFGTLTTMLVAPERQADWPAGTLTGGGFEPDPDDKGASPGMRAVLLAENVAAVRGIAARLQPGRRAWVKGAILDQVIRVDEMEVIPYPRAGAIPNREANTTVRFEFIDVGAWHNRMPPDANIRHLVLNFKAQNLAADRKDRTVKIERIFYSFSRDKEGVAARRMSLINPDTGMAGGRMEMPLPHGKTIEFGIRGEDIYPDGHVNEDLYVIVILSVGEERVVLRQNGKIIEAF